MYSCFENILNNDESMVFFISQKELRDEYMEVLNNFMITGELQGFGTEEIEKL